MEPKIIAVIGTPGIGKSFLVKKLAEKLKATEILEEREGIPERIIENIKENKRQVETFLWFRNKRIEDMKRALTLKKKGNVVVIDTCLLSGELYGKHETSGFEQEIVLKLAQSDRELIPNPDIIVFLDASEDKIKELTLKRGRDYDTSEEFIQRSLGIKKIHNDYIRKTKDPIISVNRDNLDFENEQHLQKVIDSIKKIEDKQPQ